MKYNNKQLTIENINFRSLAKKFGTPAYCYSYSKLKENIKNFKENSKGDMLELKKHQLHPIAILTLLIIYLGVETRLTVGESQSIAYDIIYGVI